MRKIITYLILVIFTFQIYVLDLQANEISGNKELLNAMQSKDITNVETVLSTYNIPNEYALRASINHKNTTIVKYLLEQGVDPNENIESKYPEYTHLMAAIDNSDYEIASALIQYGANPNDGCAFDGVFETPLTLTIDKGSIKILKLLLQNGANAYSEYHSEIPPILIYAVENNNPNPDIIRTLLTEKLDPNTFHVIFENANPTPQINTVLEYALRLNNKPIASILKKAGAMKNLSNQNLINIFKSHKSKTMRLYAAEALGYRKDFNGINMLITAIENPTYRWAQFDLIYILGQSRSKLAIDPLIRLLKESSAAVYALQKITGKKYGRDPNKWKAWREQEE